MHRRAGTAANATTTRAGWWAAVAGLVAGLAGLAVADLLAGLLWPAGSPVSAVGETIIGLLPASLVNWGKDVLGTADKPVLLAIIAVFVLLVSGMAGALERRRNAGGIVFAVLAAIGGAAVLSRPNATIFSILPTILGLGVAYLILRQLIGRLARWYPRRRHRDDAAGAAVHQARRSFLGLTAFVGAGAVIGAIAGRALSAAANAALSARSALRLPGATVPAPPIPPGADLGVADLSPYVTPNADFYRIDTALQVPVINPENWSLRVLGMVENEISITFDELLAKPLVEHLVTLCCVSNEVGGDLIGNAAWLGYPIREVLAQAKPRPGADMVLSRSHDGFTAGTPLEVLTDPHREALLAVGMNGEPLPLEHGFPVRMVVPGLYGYVSATKWVTELKVTTFEDDYGYWTPLGWSDRGPIKLSSRIDTPRGSTVDAGVVAVAGVAWAQHTGISKVEVRVDGGAWQQAKLAATTGPDSWRQWRVSWQATRGQHTLTVRATDTNGNLQLEQSAPPQPDGATGWHSIAVTVR
ncbi:MAG TPA: molybdopterin-dependent oxidoreductase [Propionibacteriaceae bacterium]|nr:molybdopterin-dependent oxidoreductase [Propionibacteriaceae bacterium]